MPYLLLLVVLASVSPSIFVFQWWQIPLQISAILLAIALLSVLVLNLKEIKRNLLSVFILVSCIGFFLYLNWKSFPKQRDLKPALTVSLNNSQAEIKVQFDPPQILINSDAIKVLEPPVYSLNQKLGQVGIAKLSTSDGKNFDFALIETDSLFSPIGWKANMILMRRLSASLRQNDQPLIVVFKSTAPAGSTVLRRFMFQARLTNIASLIPWRSLVGLKTPLLLARGAEFCRPEAEQNNQRFCFIFS